MVGTRSSRSMCLSMVDIYSMPLLLTAGRSVNAGPDLRVHHCAV